GLHEQIRLQLASVGVQKSNIRSSDICTYESQGYHSYRRDGENADRMFAFLRLK
ncbi:MAG: laccase, partial [Candidatus Neomarinimicrobiota bacterium]